MATIREKALNQWHVQIRRKGWPYQHATFRRKKDAQAWARKTEAEMDRGLFVNQDAARHTTFADLIELYIKHVTAYRPSEKSRVSETLRLKRFLRTKPKLCSHAIINLQPEMFEAYRDRRLKQPASRGKSLLKTNKFLAPSTVKRELNLFKRVIDYKKRKLGLTYNPVNTEDVKRPVVNDERDIRLTNEEMTRFMQECARARNPLLLPIVIIAFETGARQGSILKLTWNDINIVRRTALLRGVKNSRNPEKIINHSIGLTPYAVDVLNSLPHVEDRIFPITANALRLAFNRARQKANVTHFRFHDTRHERISSLFEAGWSMIQVMAQSGHRDPKSVQRYANLSGDFLAQELAKL